MADMKAYQELAGRQSLLEPAPVTSPTNATAKFLAERYAVGDAPTPSGYYGDYASDPNNAVVKRGMLLPGAQYSDGKIHPAWPGFVHDAWEGYKAFTHADPRDNSPEATDRLAKASFDVAGLAMTGGLAAPRPANSIGMFGGRLAKTADQAALAEAEKMAASGADRQAIWDATGWFQGPDKKWRYEIDDSAAKYKPDFEGKTLPDAVRHDAAYQAYPWLAEVPASRNTLSDWRGERLANGTYDPVKGISIHDDLGTKTGRSTALHEMQHGVQDKENFGQGYNPSEAAQDIGQARLTESELLSKIGRYQDAAGDEARGYMAKATQGDKDAAEFVSAAQKRWEGVLGRRSDDNPYGVTPEQAVQFEIQDRDEILKRAITGYQNASRISRLDPFELYKRHAGETEARTVQKRMDLTPEERRARPPWLDYDVPESQQIVRFNEGKSGSSASMAPGGDGAFTLPPSDAATYIRTSDYEKALHAPYAGGAVSSRQVPFAGDLPPIGSWRMSDRNGLYGRDIEHLRQFKADELLLPEIREGKLDPTKRGDDARYAEWMKEGKRPPPIDVLQMDDGRFRVMDGHRRALAAQQAGQPIDAWVSYAVPTGKVDANGNPMKTSLTYELAHPSGERISGKAGREGSLNQSTAEFLKERYGDSSTTGDLLYSNPKESAAIPAGIKALESRALPMDLESKLARAREMGFDLDTPLHHNSRTPRLTEFRPVSKSTNDMGLLGPVETERHGAFFSNKPEFSAEYGPHAGQYVSRAENPATITDNMRLDFADSLDAFGPDRDLWMQAKHGIKEPWQLFEGKLGQKFVQWLRDNGHDAAKFYEETTTRAGGHIDGNTTVILDPEKIRSIDATFDPAMSHSPNLLASNPRESAAIPLGVKTMEGGQSMKPKFDWGPRDTSGSREAKIGDTTITYGVNPKTKYADVILVKTPESKRGEGSARQAMQQMVSEADANGYTLSLTADPMGKGVSKPKLIEFYKSLGFKENTGRNKDFAVRAGMIRPPKR